MLRHSMCIALVVAGIAGWVAACTSVENLVSDYDAAADSAIDATVFDAEPRADADPACEQPCASCGVGECCVESCEGGDCAPACSNGCSCDLDCKATTGTCAPRCTGADCVIDCRGVAACQATCGGDSSCEIDCRGAGACDQTSCQGAAGCLLRCAGAGSCGFANCEEATAQSCLGDIIVCNRDCPS